MVLHFILCLRFRCRHLSRHRFIPDLVNITVERLSVDSSDYSHLHKENKEGAEHLVCSCTTRHAAIHAPVPNDG